MCVSGLLATGHSTERSPRGGRPGPPPSCHSPLTRVMSREAAAALMCRLGCRTELLQSRARAKVPTELGRMTDAEHWRQPSRRGVQDYTWAHKGAQGHSWPGRPQKCGTQESADQSGPWAST